MSMAVLPLAPVKRIAKRSGVHRVSSDAAEALRDAIEEIAADLAKDAVAASRHAGRSTIQDKDIKLVGRKTG